jgi:hypothetical protein
MVPDVMEMLRDVVNTRHLDQRVVEEADHRMVMEELADVDLGGKGDPGK